MNLSRRFAAFDEIAALTIYCGGFAALHAAASTKCRSE
jgi:hypothetical protein